MRNEMLKKLTIEEMKNFFKSEEGKKLVDACNAQCGQDKSARVEAMVRMCINGDFVREKMEDKKLNLREELIEDYKEFPAFAEAVNQTLAYISRKDYYNF